MTLHTYNATQVEQDFGNKYICTFEKNSGFVAFGMVCIYCRTLWKENYYYYY